MNKVSATFSMNLLRAWLQRSPVVSEVARFMAGRSIISQKKLPSRVSSTLSRVRQLNSNDMYIGRKSIFSITKSLRSRRRPFDQINFTSERVDNLVQEDTFNSSPKIMMIIVIVITTFIPLLIVLQQDMALKVCVNINK